jgi:triacylglycerol lipase
MCSSKAAVLDADWNQTVKIPFVFANPVQDITPLGSDDPARLQLASLAARMWASFVADLDPNGHGGKLAPVYLLL